MPGPTRRRLSRRVVDRARTYDPGMSIDERERLDDLSLYDAAMRLQGGLISHATDGSIGNEEYMALRRRLMLAPQSKALVPKFLRDCRDTEQFWQYIKHRWKHYAERRVEIYEAFAPLLATLEGAEASPSDQVTSDVLSTLDESHVLEAWHKAIERRLQDPEGAITAARTLLESVCKLILDDLSVEYKDDDLPKLYGKVAKALRLAPSDHTEEAFKQILSGCYSVVNGLGTLRNRLSDSHGQGAKPVRPGPRHAELAVNLSGAMSSFLVATWKARPPNN